VINTRLTFLVIILAATLATSRPALSQTNRSEEVRNYPAAYCSSVINPNLISVDGVGVVSLLGVHSPTDTDVGFDRALAATRKFVEGRNVRLEICPVRRQDEEEHLRAVIYYAEDGNWYNLNTKLLRSGLASAQDERECHLHTAAWKGFVQEAESKNRGIFHLGGKLPYVFSPQEIPPLKVTLKRIDAAQGSQVLASMQADPSVNERLADRWRRAVVDDVPARYVGSIEAKRFHRLGCIVSPDELDRVFFPSRIQAIKESYKPCVVCRP